MSEELPKRTLTGKEVEKIYGVDAGHLANLRCQKRGPKFFKVGRNAYYRPEDVDSWMFATTPF